MGCVQSNLNDPDIDEKFDEGRRSELLSLSTRRTMKGFNMLILLRRRQKGTGKERGLENNKAWLLADSSMADIDIADARSVHSSFRFSFGSQDELGDESPSSPSCAKATVFLLSLQNNADDSDSQCSRIRKIGILDRSISSLAMNLIRFSYADICSATGGFSTGNLLGRGANSCVFRGRLRFPKFIAVKQLDNEDKEAAKDFYRELMIASALDNPNVVTLIGFCIDQAGLFLVYKYVSGGSLERHLHGRKKASLSWNDRYRVAIGIAEALSYLHNGTNKCVIHRDIKPSNILLSSNRSPKLCDFGLAAWTSAPCVSFLCKTVKGTFGYLAPEYFQHGKISDKTDVYAFGVVLLELLTGRKPVNTRTLTTDGEENLIRWAKSLIMQEAIENLLDPQPRRKKRNLSRVFRMVQAADACLCSDESIRPNISDVLSILQGRETCSNSSVYSSSCSLEPCFMPCGMQKANEIQNHLAVAMSVLPDSEDADLCSG